MLVANAPHLKREIVYVIGGKVTCTNSDCYDGMNSNDVWASSDAGETWAAVNARPPFGPRWGHGGWVNKDGVLIMWGGLNALNGLYGSTTTYREVWASFNGGYDWHLCPTPPNALFLRGEQGATVNANGQLIMVGGYAYAENGQPQVRYNDVWRTDFSVENTEALAQRCGGASVVIPPEGVGMRRWPGNPTVPADTLTFSPLTRRAPWSPRIQPALLLMSSAQTYINPTDGSSGTTGPNWLLLYEGSLTAGTGPQSNENDVYASVDGGKTWVLISGIARLGQQGDKYSAYPDSSFRATSGAGNCEDPRTDDVYATGGIRSYNATYSEYSSEVWHSSDAVHWRLVNGRSFAPGRYFHSCDVDNQGRIYIIGGRTQGPVATSLLNDIWTSTNKGTDMGTADYSCALLGPLRALGAGHAQRLLPARPHLRVGRLHSHRHRPGHRQRRVGVLRLRYVVVSADRCSRMGQPLGPWRRHHGGRCDDGAGRHVVHAAVVQRPVVIIRRRGDVALVPAGVRLDGHPRRAGGGADRR